MDVGKDDRAPGCVSDVDWAPERVDYEATVLACLQTERERGLQLGGGFYRPDEQGRNGRQCHLPAITMVGACHMGSPP